MPTAREIADHALTVARNAVDEIVAFLVSDSAVEDEPRAEMLIMEGSSPRSDPRDRTTWERLGAMQLLIGGRCVVPSDEDEDDEPDQTDPQPGWTASARISRLPGSSSRPTRTMR